MNRKDRRAVAARNRNAIDALRAENDSVSNPLEDEIASPRNAPMRVFISCPSRGTITNETTISLCLLVTMIVERGWRYFIQAPGHGTCVAVMRDLIADDVLRSGYDVHVGIDDDVQFDPASIIAAIETELPIIGLLYPYRSPHRRLAAHGLKSATFATDAPPEEVNAIATGALVVRRVVYETLAKSARRYSVPFEDDLRELAQIFEFGITPDARWEPEDFCFCRKAREAGFKVHAMKTPQSLCGHVGRHTFRVEMRSREEMKEAAE